VKKGKNFWEISTLK